MSAQQDKYLHLRADGLSVNAAEFEADIVPGEGKLIDAALARGEIEFQPTGAAEEINQKPQISAAETVNSTPEEITPGAGHNSGENTMADRNVAADQLRLFIERIERLTEEKKGIADDIKDVFAEAKGQGYTPAIMREIIKERAMDKDARDEREALLDTYRAALGMLNGTPLGDYGVRVVAQQVEETMTDDELYRKATSIVVEADKASTSYLQRQLRLGYNSAARLIERMEREGIVSAPDEQGKRRVLQHQPA